jgi:hypothetical protein
MVGSGVFRNKGSKRFSRSHGNRHGQVSVVHAARTGRVRRNDDGNGAIDRVGSGYAAGL